MQTSGSSNLKFYNKSLLGESEMKTPTSGTKSRALLMAIIFLSTVAKVHTMGKAISI